MAHRVIAALFSVPEHTDAIGGEADSRDHRDAQIRAPDRTLLGGPKFA